MTDSAEVIAADVIKANILSTPLVRIERWLEQGTDGCGAQTFELVVFPSYEGEERTPYLGEPRAWIGDATWERLDRTYVEAPVTWTSSHNFVIMSNRPLDYNKVQGSKVFIDWVSERSIDWAKAGQIPVRKSVRNSR